MYIIGEEMKSLILGDSILLLVLMLLQSVKTKERKKYKHPF